MIVRMIVSILLGATGKKLAGDAKAGKRVGEWTRKRMRVNERENEREWTRRCTDEKETHRCAVDYRTLRLLGMIKELGLNKHLVADRCLTRSQAFHCSARSASHIAWNRLAAEIEWVPMLLLSSLCWDSKLSFYIELRWASTLSFYIEILH